MKDIDILWETRDTTQETPIGRIAGYPEPGKWNAWVTRQGEVWVDVHNRVFLIQEISSRYAFNILRFVWNHHRKDLGKDPVQNPLIRALVARLQRTTRIVVYNLIEEGTLVLPEKL